MGFSFSIPEHLCSTVMDRRVLGACVLSEQGRARGLWVKGVAGVVH